MSLSDITQFIGISSVPVVVAGTVLGVFELGEKLTSQRAKDALSKWLLAFDVQKAKALPDGTQELFERIFGERHFSLKCFVRSAVFSLGAMALIGFLIFLIYPQEFFKLIGPYFGRDTSVLRIAPVVLWTQFAVWLPLSILIDYASLFKTRFILGVLTRRRRSNRVMTLAILAIDYTVYRLLFTILINVSVVVSIRIVGGGAPWTEVFINILGGFIEGTYVGWVQFFPHEIGIILILYWAGFAPSLWMWLYVAALFVTRALLRSERIVNRLRWLLDIEKAPLRSIGAVAAVLAFIASVAVLLISAEISRISAAA